MNPEEFHYCPQGHLVDIEEEFCETHSVKTYPIRDELLFSSLNEEGELKNMGINWSEVEKDSQSSFLKIADGQSVTLEFISEPEKSKDQYGKTKYFSKVLVSGRLLDWNFSPLLMHEIGEALGKPASLVKRVIVVSRKGSNKEDTRYSVEASK